jgi:ADP-ribose pyrophosphatase YjhB (NUDIX family)
MRLAVRVVLLDPDDRVLLLRTIDPVSGEAFWFPPGGGLEGEEDARAAAVREVFEETGLRDVALGPELWDRRHAFAWGGRTIDQYERWFLARVAAFEPTRDGFTPQEADEIVEARWWTLDELHSAGERLVPDDFAQRLTDVLGG